MPKQEKTNLDTALMEQLGTAIERKLAAICAEPCEFVVVVAVASSDQDPRPNGHLVTRLSDESAAILTAEATRHLTERMVSRFGITLNDREKVKFDA